jgi:hypothetical protein
MNRMDLVKSTLGREPKPHHAIFVTFTRLLLCAYEAKERACSEPTIGAQADAAVAAIMAVASFEAFLNELAEFALVAEKSDWTRQTAFVAKLKDYASHHAQITREQKREQSRAKYQAAASILAGITLDWGERENQELALLIRVRDDLVHIKPAMSSTSSATVLCQSRRRVASKSYNVVGLRAGGSRFHMRVGLNS